MEYKVHDQLDPLFETASLLLLCAQGDPRFVREETIRHLSEFGLDGEAFYSRNGKAYDKYFRVFAQNQKLEPGDEELLQGSYAIFFMRVLPFLQDPSQLERRDWDAQRLTEVCIHACGIYCEEEGEPPTGQAAGDARALMEFVRKTSLDEADRWRAFELLCDPRPSFLRMAALLERNLPAQKKAQQAVAKPLEALIGRMGTDPMRLGGAYFVKKPEDVACVWPSLAVAFGLLIADEICYCGLLCEPLMELSQSKGEADQMLAARLKALGDKTRLAIMDELARRGGSYNAELAQALGLTPATISHHLDLLLTAGLLEMRQEDKRVYCSVKERAVEEAAEALCRRFGGQENRTGKT